MIKIIKVDLCNKCPYSVFVSGFIDGDKNSNSKYTMLCTQLDKVFEGSINNPITILKECPLEELN